MSIEIWANALPTTISGGVSTGATSITVADGSTMASPSSGQYFKLWLIQASNTAMREIAHCTGRSGNTLTVVRAQEGTTALTFTTDDIALAGPTAQSMLNVVGNQVNAANGIAGLDSSGNLVGPIIIYGGTASAIASFVPQAKQFAFATDTMQLGIGDGTATFASLAYQIGPSGGVIGTKTDTGGLYDTGSLLIAGNLILDDGGTGTRSASIYMEAADGGYGEIYWDTPQISIIFHDANLFARSYNPETSTSQLSLNA